MAFDFKKEYKEFYLPAATPQLVDVPNMNFIAVRGSGDPNEEGGAYQQALGVLYALAYTIKMSYKGEHKIQGFFEYVVPPLEGFWWQDGVAGVDYAARFCHGSRFSVGQGRSEAKEKAGLLGGGISHPPRGALRPDHAPGFL